MTKEFVPQKAHLNPNRLYPDDIRHFIFDRSVEDNSIELDLAFSDEEIQNAFRYMCMSFNSITPYCMSIGPDAIPNTMWAIHGTCYHLLLSKYHKESRNDMSYNADGVTVEVQKTLIQHLLNQIKLHKNEFDTMAKHEKLNKNINDAFNIGIG